MDTGTSQISGLQFRNLVANIPGIVYRCANDEYWTMHFISGKVEQLTGYPASDFINNAVRTYDSLIHPEDKNMINELVKDGLDKREPYHLEYRILPKSGNETWVMERGQGVYDDNDQLLWLDGIILDITDTKKLQELKQEVDRMMRHDLRNPLNVIISMPQVIKRDWDLNQEQFDSVDLIEKAGKKMLDMVNLSLDLYKIELGQYQFHPEKFNVINVLKSAIADLDNLGKIHKVGTKLTCNDQPVDELSIVELEAEELLCYSIFSNLLRNAIEASAPGETVNINLTNSPNELLINISNSKPIPEAIRDNFFDKYVTHGKREGTGLGTYIAKLMVEVQNGEIHVISSLEKGTCVGIRFQR